MDDKFTRAKHLKISANYDGSSLFTLCPLIDGENSGTISIRFPRPYQLNKRHIALIALMGSAILAKLCLAENVLLDFECTPLMVDSILPIFRLLYDVRCYRDKRPVLPSPSISLVKEKKHLASITNPQVNDSKHAYLLWSGGKDSTLSLLLLRANRYRVSTVHATANQPTVSNERKAVESLSKLLNSPTDFIEIDSQLMVKIGKMYSATFDRFPEYNAIPHGRDFLLLTLLATMGSFDNSHIVCSGSEYELYTKVIPYGNTLIYRHDSQSEKGYELLTECLRLWYGAGYMAFSPVASFTEFRSFKILLDKAPETFNYISSCFWGNWCGQCFKCFRYSLLQEVFSKDIFKFEVHPLYGCSFADKYIHNWSDKTLPFWQEIHYCFSVLMRSKNSLEKYAALRIYKEYVYPKIVHSIDGIYQNYLMKTHKIKLIPDGFDPSSLDRCSFMD